MRAEYAQRPPMYSLERLPHDKCEVTLRENITEATRTTYENDGERETTYYTADEYCMTVTVREGLEEAVSNSFTEWLAMAKEKELESLLAGKLEEVSAACYATIVAGCTVTMADGTEGHFSLEETDQINLNAAFAAVEQGAAGYPYHADGQLCRLYPAEDIRAIAEAATAHKLYHTTYCNHLMMWARRSESSEELTAIRYGAALPEDLAANMAGVISSAASL